VVGRLAISSENIGTAVREPVPAAQYVRMSTEHQRYSTENQSDAILQYAVRCGFDIVRTYADNGKSGLRLDSRDALKQLLIDVEGGSPRFKAVLVYDVSRWGRFQDADESAYYEYVCRRSGVEIRYCAEQFENDGSVASTIVKTVKRAMAGEYSRELSAKVFAGQCRLIELGFRQGGHAGYGLRRRLVDQNGNPEAILAFGEQKSLQSDRVVLELGPVEEVETVRRMFRMFVHEGKHQRKIAAILNQEQIRTDLGRRWTASSVQQVLTNEKYIGNNVFNQASAKLTNKRIANPPEMWVRAVSVFPAIVDPELFRAAQARLAMRNRHPRSERALPQLFVGLWYGGQAIPRKPHHSSGERTNRRCRCRRAAGRAGSGALCGPIDDGADRRSQAPASGFPLSAVPTMPDRRSVIRAESCPVWPPPVRCRSVTVPGSREARRFPALPPFRPASCAAIPNNSEPSSPPSPSLQTFPGSNQPELWLIEATLQEAWNWHSFAAGYVPVSKMPAPNPGTAGDRAGRAAAPDRPPECCGH
jgi:DNA invertase Pin-like site-specific DNA recombinase